MLSVWRWLIPSGVNRNHSALFQRKTSVFWLEAELLPLQRKLNLPNIIRWKEYMCIILTTKQWQWEEGSCLLLWGTWHWCSLSGRFQFICKCDDIFSFLYQERKCLGKLVVECILPWEQQMRLNPFTDGGSGLGGGGIRERKGQMGVWQWIILVWSDLDKMYLFASFLPPSSFPPKSAGQGWENKSIAESDGVVVCSWPEGAGSRINECVCN